MGEITVTRVKSIYGEIKGYYKGLPKQTSGPYCVPSMVGQNFNHALDELISVSGSDYSRFKISTEELSKGDNCNIRIIEPLMSAVITKLSYEYSFDSQKRDNSPNIVILNKNSNEVSVNIDYTIDELIQKNTGEAKTKLNELKEELGKENKNWEIIKNSLIWILNFSKDLFLEVLPILLGIDKKI